jgi:hypothetical protein
MPGDSSVKMKWPASCKTITQKFGNKSSRYVSGYHTGLDIGCLAGTPIYAATDGTVTFAGYNGPYGNEVRIEFNSALVTSYHHMSRIAANKGQSVSAGKIIGYIGSTGQSTGPHLHFEVRVNNKAVDPAPYLAGAALPDGSASQAGYGDSIPGLSEAKAVYDTLKASAAIFEWLTNTKNWLRVGMVLAGAVLIWLTVVGIGKSQVGGLLGDSAQKAGKKVISSVKRKSKS